MPRSFRCTDIPPRRVRLVGVALLALAVAILYGHTLHVPWYFDDHAAILENAAVHDLGRAAAGIWQPRGVSILSFALNYRFSGAAVAGYHLTNIGMHLLCAWLVYRLLGRIFPEGRLRPLLGALLFAAHPLQTQAVTYIVQRMTLLAALFFLLALELFICSREKSQDYPGRNRGRWYYLGALAAGMLAVLAKENAAVLPLALVLFVRCFGPGDRSWRPLLLAATPFFVVPLVLTATGLLFPMLFGSESLAEHTGLGSTAGTPLHYLVTQFSVFWIYLRLLVLPYGQTLDYGYPIVTSLWTGKSILAFCALAGLGWGGWRVRERLPTVSFGLGWFFLALAVESSFIPLDPIFEHRLYLPLLGFVVALLGLARELPERVAATGLILAIVVCGYLTWQRNALWNDPLAFSRDNVHKAPHSDRALFNLAARTFNHGSAADGVALLRQAIERFPRSYPAYVELADYYRRRGQIAEAIAVLQRALEYVPEKALIYNNLGFFHMLRHESDQALAVLKMAQQADPRFADAYFNTARIHAANNRLPEAEVAFLRGFRESRQNSAAFIDFAALLLRQGRRAEALDALRTAQRLDPENAAAARLLGEAVSAPNSDVLFR